MSRLQVLCLLLASMPALVAAGGPVDQLVKSDIVEGRFVQESEMPGLQQPLRAEGRFIFWRGQGIFWQTEQPFRETLSYTRQKTLRWHGPGVIAEELDSHRDNYFRKILLAIFSFDQQQLAAQFDDHLESAEGRWRLVLTPNNPMSRQSVSEATLEGGEFIDAITIARNGAQKISIAFSEQQTGARMDQSRCVDLFGYSIDECTKLLGPGQQGH